MKRSWIGLGLLLALLTVGLLTTWSMGRIHEPVSAELEQASEFALLNDWTNAEESFRHARTEWEKWAHFRTCFADHTPVEDIDALFAQLQIYSATHENAAFAAGCMELSEKVSAIGEAHGLVWWNVL